MTNRSEKRRLQSAAYYVAHPEKWQQRYEKNRDARRESAKARRLKLRQEALAAYGNVCACCGELHWQFLSIDHANNDGAQHRKQIESKRGEDIFRWLKKNNWPDGFRVLCFNCNLSIGHLGYCPHDAEKRTNGAPGID